MIFLYIFLAILFIFIITIITIPFIDNSIRFSNMIGSSYGKIKDKFPSMQKSKELKFSYKLNLKNNINVLDYKLTMGGASRIYFEFEDDILKKVLCISKFDADKWFSRIYKTYITNRKEKYIIDDSFVYGENIYLIESKKYKSSVMKYYNAGNFDFGINHNKKFFMYFY